MAETVHEVLLEAQTKLMVLENAVYQMGAEGDYINGKPSEMLAGASLILGDIRKSLHVVTATEVALDIEIPDEGDKKKAGGGAATEPTQTVQQVEGSLNEVTKEQCQKALRLIEEDLSGCLPDLTVLNGFLGEDPEIDPNAELAVRDTVAATYEAVKSAMKHMEHVL